MSHYDLNYIASPLLLPQFPHLKSREHSFTSACSLVVVLWESGAPMPVDMLCTPVGFMHILPGVLMPH